MESRLRTLPVDERIKLAQDLLDSISAKDVWDDKTFLNENEKVRIEFEVSLIGKLIEGRKSKGITQHKIHPAD